MGFGIDGIGDDLMAAFSHRRAEITKLTAQELVPRFQVEHRRAPNQRELAALQEQATLRTRVNKGGVVDWDAATRLAGESRAEGWRGSRVTEPACDAAGTRQFRAA
jgi:TrwC relaxase